MVKFGNKWTEEKLDRIRDYLPAWHKVLSNTTFTKLYIDAFAGEGVRQQTYHSDRQFGETLIPEPEDAENFFDGSAKIALKNEPPFDQYHLIDISKYNADRLSALKLEFPERYIRVAKEDANTEVRRLCKQTEWNRTRAVLFLDPFALQVQWETIEAIAQTKAIDMWYLFPLGAANRLLMRDKDRIPQKWAERLDLLFGTGDWQKMFYEEPRQSELFGGADEKKVERHADAIEAYLYERLLSVFPSVAKNMLRLKNSKNVVMFTLCFAAANEGCGGKHAVKIANHLLNPEKARNQKQP